MRICRAAVLATVALPLVGCYGTEMASVSPKSYVETAQPDHVVVRLRGQPDVRLENPYVAGDSLVGYETRRQKTVSIALADVQALGLRRLDEPMTNAVVGSTLSVVIPLTVLTLWPWDPW